MFCVVQKIQRKKPEKGVEYREYAVDSFTIRFPDGTEIKRYTYGPKYESGKFERPIREAYKISIHESHYNWGSYSIPTASTYNEDETAILKQFYRSLSKAYHPDLNPDKDTTAAMQLLNKLKDQWGV